MKATSLGFPYFRFVNHSYLLRRVGIFQADSQRDSLARALFAFWPGSISQAEPQAKPVGGDSPTHMIFRYGRPVD